MRRRTRSTRAADTKADQPSSIPILPARPWIAWIGLALRAYVGWRWLDDSWSRSGWHGAGQELTAIAVLLGALTGPAALAGAALQAVGPIAGNPASDLLALAGAAVLIAGWRVAGRIGFDRWLIPLASGARPGRNRTRRGPGGVTQPTSGMAAAGRTPRTR